MSADMPLSQQTGGNFTAQEDDNFRCQLRTLAVQEVTLSEDAILNQQVQ